jgi:hypothetical protein
MRTAVGEASRTFPVSDEAELLCPADDGEAHAKVRVIGVRCPWDLLGMGVWGFISFPANWIAKWQAFAFLESRSRLVSLFLPEPAMPHCIAKGLLPFLDI